METNHYSKFATWKVSVVFYHIEKGSRRFGIIFVQGSGKRDERVLTFRIWRDRNVEGLGHFAENLVALTSNQQVGFLVLRRPLQVNNHQLAFLRPEHFVSFQDFETCSDANNQISLS